MTSRARDHLLTSRLADWGLAIASLGLIAGIMFTTMRPAPADEPAAAWQLAQSGAPQMQKPPASAEEQTPKLPNTGESLSERLDRGNGVIAPPSDADPGIQRTPKEPNAGSSMPVIPPPANSERGTPQ